MGDQSWQQSDSNDFHEELEFVSIFNGRKSVTMQTHVTFYATLILQSTCFSDYAD